MKYFGPKINHSKLESIKSTDELSNGELYLEADSDKFLSYQVDFAIENELIGEFVGFDKNSSTLFDKNYNLKIYEGSEVQYGVSSIGARIQKKGGERSDRCIPVCKGSGKGKPALFLDRDGIIVEGDLYSIDPKRVTLRSEIIPHLQMATQKGFQIIVVSNQSGVGRGYFSEDELQDFHQNLDSQLKDLDISMTHWFYSPCHVQAKPPYNKKSILRKPYPGMVLWACEKYDVNILKSLMVGDRETDRLALPGFAAKLIFYKEELKSKHYNTFDELFNDFWFGN